MNEQISILYQPVNKIELLFLIINRIITRKNEDTKSNK